MNDLSLLGPDAPNLVLDAQVDAAASVLRADEGSPQLAGAVITGQGGVGKSALLGLLLRRLAAEGWAVAVHHGRWLPLSLFDAVWQAVYDAPDSFPRRAEALEVLADRRCDLARLDLVCDLLARARLALAFDDLGQNLTRDGEEFADPGFATLFDRLCGAADQGRVLATSRSPLPGPWPLRRLHLGPLTDADALRLAAQLPRLAALDVTDRAAVVTALCGHPRLLALADTWLSVGADDPASALEMLLARLPRIEPPGGARTDEIDGYREAAVPILRAIVLTLHARALAPPLLQMLLQAAVSTVPVTARHLAAACDRRHRSAEQRRSPDAEDVRAAEDAGHRLMSLGLMAGSQARRQGLTVDGEFLVGAWIADGLVGHHGDELGERHERAIQTHRCEHGIEEWSCTSLVAIARHLIALRRWADLTAFALDATRFTLDRTSSSAHPLADAALLGEIVPAVPADQASLPRLVERQIAVLRRIGLVPAASEVADRFHHRVTRWAASAGVALDADVVGDDDPARADLVATACERLGDAAWLNGATADAERAYRRSLKIRMRRYAAAPTPGTLRALAPLVQRAADLLVDLGDPASARRLRRTLVDAAKAVGGG